MSGPAACLLTCRGKGPLPAWPAFSIGLLTVLAAIFQAGLVTALMLYLLFLAVMVWSGTGVRIDRSVGIVAWPFLVMLVLGLIVGLGADRYLYLKDTWYVLNPLLVMAMGFVFYFSMPDIGRGLKAFVVGGSLISLLNLVPLALHPEILMYSANRIRGITGAGFIASPLAITILVAYRGRWREGLNLRPWLAWSCLLTCAASLVASFSRTDVIVAVIGILAAAGFFARREIQRTALISAVGFLLLAGAGLISGLDGADSRQTFFGKLLHSVDELTVREYSDIRSINDNWRGYETARALKVVSEGPAYGVLVGQGFGSQVGLGAVAMMAGPGSAMHEIPILHNGFAYLLVKGGAVAIVAYLIFLGRVYWIGRRQALVGSGGSRAGARVLQGVVVSLAVTTWVISGAFNKFAAFPLLLAIGFLVPALTRGEAAAARDGHLAGTPHD